MTWCQRHWSLMLSSWATYSRIVVAVSMFPALKMGSKCQLGLGSGRTPQEWNQLILITAVTSCYDLLAWHMRLRHLTAESEWTKKKRVRASDCFCDRCGVRLRLRSDSDCFWFWTYSTTQLFVPCPSWQRGFVIVILSESVSVSQSLWTSIRFDSLLLPWICKTGKTWIAAAIKHTAAKMLAHAVPACPNPKIQSDFTSAVFRATWYVLIPLLVLLLPVLVM